VARSLFEVLRGSSNLVFPNSRSDVEFYSDSLRRFCEEQGFPNEFWPHHGNLSKEIREETEAALKQTERPATAVCTSTLELGIDIGPVKSVVQIGPPPSVASLRQRLGRSGRRKGEPMILRAYCIEDEITQNASLSKLLRENLVCTSAMIRLVAAGWYEPICTTKLHGSTLIQQTLAVLSQYGGAHAQTLWELLCGAGPFRALTAPLFSSLLKELGKEEIIFQDATGLILLALKGERIVEHYGFYAAFSTDEEYSIVSGNRTLGSMPVTRPLAPESFLIFAGRRWQVISVSQNEKFVEVKPAAGGTVPAFDGVMGADVHDRVREEMRQILRSDEPLPFLDSSGQDLLKEARENYHRLGLDRHWLLQMGNEVHVLLWRGDRTNDTLLLMLTARGMNGMSEGLSVSIKDTTVSQLREVLATISNEPPVTTTRLAATVQNKVREKWDHLLPEELLDASFSSSSLDVAGVHHALKDQLGNGLDIRSEAADRAVSLDNLRKG
jgi:ATP-dependent Lhr-like helicase